MVAVRWSNGHVDTASTWPELFESVRKSQWRAYDETSFRRAMAWRALQWSGLIIDHEAPARRFFHELEAAKLVMIDRDDDRHDDTTGGR